MAASKAKYLNRELSWLEFNQRVLDEALDPSNPLLERVKFFSIASTNLDEFFEVRVAGIKQQIESGMVKRRSDGLTPSETLRAVSKRVRRMVDAQYQCWRRELRPLLHSNGIRFLSPSELVPADKAWVGEFYRSQVRPVLTPLGLDPAHPFPQLLNKSLNIIVAVETTQEGESRRRLAVVQVPRVLPRLIRLPRADVRHDYVFLGDIIGAYLADLFPGTTLRGFWRFRVTRNSELYIDEEDAANLLEAVENELHKRRRGDAVRLEVEQDCPQEIREELLHHLALAAEDLYAVDGPLNPSGIMILYDDVRSPELRDPPFVPPVAAALRGRPDLFEAIRERDILLHHPYENFSSVLDFLRQSAEDPQVLAIKQTLYRTGGDASVVGALMKAVENGKQVTAVVELKARFDEANNILWARRLEEAGVHVVYGLVGYKIHAKMCLVVRKDEDGIRRYLHLSTGNYNPGTARVYTDIGLLTCNPHLGEDATNLFNLLTGICQFQSTRKAIIAPFQLHDRMLSLIRREAANARQGLPARIIAKMNSLVDEEIIDALYDASTAGVKIDLIVRGVCCLRPQVRALSENITVRSIVDRFLEHSRIFYFENGCRPEIFLGSADWMPRNFFRRIEVVFPIEDGNLRDRIQNEILQVILSDNLKSRHLSSDGSYHLSAPEEGATRRRSQADLIEIAGRPERSAGSRIKRPSRVRLAPNPFKEKKSRQR